MCLANSSYHPQTIDLSDADIGYTLFLHSQNYPFFYAVDLTCLWIVESAKGTKLQIDFETFRLITEGEYLTIGDGDNSDNDDTIIFERGRMMNTRMLTSTGNKIWIRWFINSASFRFDIGGTHEVWIWRNEFYDARMVSTHGDPLPFDRTQWIPANLSKPDVTPLPPPSNYTTVPPEEFGFLLRLTILDINQGKQVNV